MEIQNNIIKYFLRNVFFITGTAYAGKSTMVKLLAEKHSMIFCGENYHSAIGDKIKTPEKQPASCYFETMSGWQEFLNRSPEDYYSWICESAKEAAQMEIAQLIHLSASGKRIIVDTNIPVEILHEISDYHHVAIMLSPQAMSVERFFDRDDPEKKFLFEQISIAKDPEKTMNNFRDCLAKLNSQEEYNRHANSGFFTLVRKDANVDTKEQVLAQLEQHFGLHNGSKYMKVEIGNERPANFKEAWPGEYSFFSHFEHCAVVPQVLCMITTIKQNGKPNACFHSGATFMGDSTGYYVLLPGICNSHTYDNILRDKQFSVNFLSSQHYSGCKKTVVNNDEDIDEILIGGFTSEPCKTIDGFRIKESILSFECKLSMMQDVTGNGHYLIIGKVELAIVEEECHKLEKICGEHGFMYNIPSPQSPLTAERMPTAAASLRPFCIKE